MSMVKKRRGKFRKVFLPILIPELLVDYLAMT